MTFTAVRRWFGLAFLSAMFAPAAGAQIYVVTDLGTLGGNSSYAFGVNDSGAVVGNSNIKTTSSDYQAFSYLNNKSTGLGFLGSGASSEAYAVNNSGTVVGDSFTQGSSIPHAFAYSSGGGLSDLGTLGGTRSYGYAINSAGVATGYSEITPGSSLDHAFLYDTTKSGASMTELTATNGATTLGGASANAYGINDSGVVVGSSNPQGSPANHGFYFSGGTFYDTGTLGGANSFALGVNNKGVAVGYSETSIAGQQRAFSYTLAGGIQNLGTLPGTGSSRATAINNTGDIVGYTTTVSGVATNYTAFLSSNGNLVSLNSLAGGSNWNLQYAYGINSAGTIVGYGTNPQGKIHAFALGLATPAPSSLLLSLVGAGGIGLAVRRKKSKG